MCGMLASAGKAAWTFQRNPRHVLGEIHDQMADVGGCLDAWSTQEQKDLN